MDETRQFFKFNKFQPASDKNSSFHMMIEDFDKLNLCEIVTSKKIHFLGSDDVWWISIAKDTRGTLLVRNGVIPGIKVNIFLQASDYIRNSGNCCYYVSGTVNEKPFKSIQQNIPTMPVPMSSSVFVDVGHSQPILEVKLEIKISQSENSDKLPLQKFIDATVQYENIVSNYKNILNKSKYSDFTVVVRGKRFKVHKNIVVAASPVFDKVFGAKFSETASNESHVKHTDPITFQHLLNFIYCGELPENIHEVSRALFTAAHYYQINELVEICAGVEHYKLTKDNAVDVYEWADTYNLENMQLDAWKIIQFDILEIFNKGQPPPSSTVRSLVANKIEAEKLLEEYQLKRSKLAADAKDLLK